MAQLAANLEEARLAGLKKNMKLWFNSYILQGVGSTMFIFFQSSYFENIAITYKWNYLCSKKIDIIFY